MDFPKPQLGYYQAECCLLDLYKIETQEELEDAQARIADNDECGPLMVFATLAEAVAFLADDHSPIERAEQFARLGWTEPPPATEPEHLPPPSAPSSGKGQ